MTTPKCALADSPSSDRGSLETTILTTRDEADWEDFVRSSPRANVYHTLEWKRILELAFGYSSVYLLCRDSSGELHGILPLAYVNSFLTGRRLVSLPFSQYCGPVWTDLQALSSILPCARGMCVRLKARHVLLKMSEGLGTDAENWTQAESNYYFRSVIPLEGGVDAIWRRMHRLSARWGVRKATRLGVTVDMSEDSKDADVLYYLMLKNSKRHGTPAYPRRLFDEIYRTLLPHGLAKVFLARYGRRPIAALVLSTLSSAMPIYHFSDEAYFRTQPNALLYWHVIRWSSEEGYREFDLGITSPFHRNLLRFKLHLGAKTSQTHYYFLSVNRETGRKGISLDSTSPFFNACGKILGAVPLPLFSKIGPKLMPHFG